MRQGPSAAFDTPIHAKRALRELVEIGIPRGQIVMRSAELEDQVGPPTARVTGAHRVALICAVAAAVVSGIVAILMVVDIIPAAGFEFLGTSILGAGVRGVVAGGAAGTLFGYILGMGMWDTDGEPDTPVASLDIVVSVQTEIRLDDVRATLENAGGRLI